MIIDIEPDDRDPLYFSDPHPDSDPEYEASDGGEQSDEECDEKSKKQAVPKTLMNRISQTKGSYRLCESLLKVGVEISGANPNNYCLSKTSLWKQMISLRSEQKEELHSLLAADDCKLVIQFDGKNYKTLNARHLGTEERLIVMCHTEQFDVPLGLFRVDSKSSLNCVLVIINAIKKHSLQQRVVGVVCDTERVNTGRRSGICLELERALKTDLLNLMCRHHIFEVVLKDVFEAIFGGTTGARITTFDSLKKNWNRIKSNGFRYAPMTDDEMGDPMVFEFAQNAIHSISSIAKHHHFRDDYAELQDLALKFLGIRTSKSFNVPGATNNARWMQRAIYALKMYLFQDQIDISSDFALSIHRFCLFVSLIYVKFWSVSPIALDAPSNDIQFLKELDQYRQIDEEISDVALNALKRHLWYLSDELIMLSLFSDKVSDEEKFYMSILLIPRVGSRTNNSIKHSNEIHNIQDLSLSDFISNRSYFLLRILDIDTNFLSVDPENWNENESYLMAQSKIRNLIVVVNDSSERALQKGANIIDGQRVQSENRLQDLIVSTYHKLN